MHTFSKLLVDEPAPQVLRLLINRPAAIRRAVELAALPQGAFARMKLRLNRVSSTFDEELEREEGDQAALLCSDDFREGYTAFVEKRTADFAHRQHGKI